MWGILSGIALDRLYWAGIQVGIMHSMPYALGICIQYARMYVCSAGTATSNRPGNRLQGEGPKRSATDLTVQRLSFCARLGQKVLKLTAQTTATRTLVLERDTMNQQGAESSSSLQI